MSDKDTKTTTQSTAPSNPNVVATVDKLLGGVQQAQGNPGAGASLYAGVGPTTRQSWESALTAAGNPAYSGAVNGAISSFGNAAAGKSYGLADPGYAALRAKVADDTLTGTNKAFAASGLFGSDSNQRAAAEGLGTALAGLDYNNFTADRNWQAQAAQMLPGLYQASQSPASTIGAIGSAQDLDAQSKLSGPTDLLAKLSSILAGNAQVSGQTQTNTEPATPWWQTAAGLGLGAAGMFL